MEKTPDSHQPPEDISAVIAALEVGETHLFRTAKPQSVKAIASRIGGHRRRYFKTKKMPDGTRVWRLRKQKAAR